MSKPLALQDLLAQDKRLIDDYLRQSVFVDYEARQQAIVDAMSYSLNAGGKRLRAIMLLRVARNWGGDDTVALAFAAAIELIHAYSLVHDDLPAMDDDDLRRGKPTNHVVYGEAMAILAGDGLLNYAFELMSRQSLQMAEAKRGLQALHEIARAAGFRGMLGGQVADVLAERTEIDAATLDYIHSRKTAALLTSALVAGAHLAGCSNELVEAHRRFGDDLGMAFQIVDDILDVVGDSAQLGKPVGSDQSQHKNTYVSMYGLAKSRKMAAYYTERARCLLPKIDDDAHFFDKLSRALLARAY